MKKVILSFLLILALMPMSISYAVSGDPVIEGAYVIDHNLLTNPGFGMWSNSDGVFPKVDSFVSGYVSASGTSITILTKGTFIVGDHVSTSAGYTTDGAGGLGETDAGTSIYEITAVTADGGSRYLTVEGDALVSGSVSAVTDVFLVMPGVTEADNDGPTGWHKDNTTLDIWRAPISGVSKEGSIYSLYFKKGTANDETFSWPLGDIKTMAEHYLRFAGKTVTAGIYVNTWAANNIRLRMTDGVTNAAGDWHTGTGNWEWLELTRTNSVSPTTFHVQIEINADSGDTAYVTQPCLVFGSSIGAGNCVNEPGEVVWAEDGFTLNGYNLGSYSNVSATTENLEVKSNLKIPKNVVVIFIKNAIRDSGSGGADVSMNLRGIDSNAAPIVINIGNTGLTLANDNLFYHTAWLPLNSDGDYRITINASGTLTTGVLMEIHGIQIR